MVEAPVSMVSEGLELCGRDYDVYGVCWSGPGWLGLCVYGVCWSGLVSGLGWSGYGAYGS